MAEEIITKPVLDSLYGTNQYKVKIQDTQTRQVVVFNVTPELSESRSVNYTTVDPIHAPGQIYAYVNTSSRTYQLNVKLVSRTSEEASRNLDRLNMIKSWAMPTFGEQNNDADTLRPIPTHATELGAPPSILELSAYTSVGGKRKENIHKIPVVMTQYGITYPSDVDYIPTTTFSHPEINKDGTVASGQGASRLVVPFPTLMQLDLSLTETHAPKKYNQFSLAHFRRGELLEF